MTKKHYISLANAISEISDKTARRSAAYAVAKACAVHNPRFNTAIFLAYCELDR